MEGLEMPGMVLESASGIGGAEHTSKRLAIFVELCDCALSIDAQVSVQHWLSYNLALRLLVEGRLQRGHKERQQLLLLVSEAYLTIQIQQ